MEKFERVLLIDDDEVDNFLHKNILEEVQISNHIDVFRSGEEALKNIQQLDFLKKKNEKKPALILLDLNMPVMTGFEFLGALRTLAIKHYYTVILSSSDNIFDVQEAANYQVDYYICKPLTKDKLKKMIERW